MTGDDGKTYAAKKPEPKAAKVDERPTVQELLDILDRINSSLGGINFDTALKGCDRDWLALVGTRADLAICQLKDMQAALGRASEPVRQRSS